MRKCLNVGFSETVEVYNTVGVYSQLNENLDIHMYQRSLFDLCPRSLRMKQVRDTGPVILWVKLVDMGENTDTGFLPTSSSHENSFEKFNILKVCYIKNILSDNKCL